MTKRFPLTPQQVQLLRGRYTAQLEQLFPLAYHHYEAISSPEVRSAFQSIVVYNDAILNLFRVFLDEGRFSPDELETRALIALLLSMSSFWPVRGLGQEALRWGMLLFDRCQTNGWTFEPALLPFLARTHLEYSEVKRALAFIEQALDSPLLLTHPKIEALLYASLSSALFKIGQYDPAVKFALRAAEVPLEAEEPSLSADAWMQAFHALMALGRREDALKAAQTAYDFALKTGKSDIQRLVSTMVILGLAYTAVARYEEAAPLYDSGIEFYDAIGDEPNAARTRFMSAIHHYRAGKPDVSASLAHSSLLVFERYGLVQDVANAQNLINHLTPPTTRLSAAHSQTSG